VRVPESSPAPSRIELILRKPAIGWYPKPTVVFDGHGHPAQWGTGTWQIPVDGSTTVSVFLYNRVWKFGAAEVAVTAGGPARFVYRAPWLPFLPGSLRAEI
jgi:hypothetical protein